METEGRRDKTRVLPTWMTAEGPQKTVGSAKTPKRRRTTAPSASAARLPARRTVYCMNEAELVNVALSILIEGRRQKNPPEKDTARPGNGEHSRTPLMSPRSEGTSEDENSGAEALPPSTTPSQGSQNSDSALTCSQNPAEEDDTLKYVREIFFS